LTNKFYFYV